VKKTNGCKISNANNAEISNSNLMRLVQWIYNKGYDWTLMMQFKGGIWLDI